MPRARKPDAPRASLRSPRSGNGVAHPRLRFAVVGLGYIAQNAVLPAFAHASRTCELAALVSGSPAKLKALGRRHRVTRLWSYEEFDAALHGDDFDAVYIALPNHLHRTWAVRAARAGKHVLCEKPMALSVRDCDAMIGAARDHRVRLMIAYRLHLDPVNLHALEVIRSGRLGELQAFQSSFGTPVKEGDIRTRNETGGGTLWDIGIYCINAARGLFRAEPVEVFAMTADAGRPRFSEIEEMSAAVLRFPGGRLATIWSSFTSTDVATYTLIGSKGRLRIDQAYEYREPREIALTVGERTTRRTEPVRDQFAAELVYFADCVRRRKDPVPSGTEGRADVAIIRALYRSARTGRPERLHESGPARRPEPAMAISRPAVRREPRLVKTTSPRPRT